jgi:hypothetical protein
MDRFQGGTLLFEYREGFLLLRERKAFAFLLISGLALLQQVVIKPTTRFKGLIELLDLLLGWIDALLKHFTHILILAQKWQEVNGFPLCPCPKQGSRPSSPCLEMPSRLLCRDAGERKKALSERLGLSLGDFKFLSGLLWLLPKRNRFPRCC